MKIQKSASSDSGFTLVEVLVAVVILSIGLLGVAGMQINGMKGNHNAFLRSEALQYAYEMLDMMRANRTAATNGDYNIALTGTVPTVPVPDTIADQDLREWIRGIAGVTNPASGLPGGQGSVTVTPIDEDGVSTTIETWRVTITVSWTENRFADAPTPSVVVESKI